MSCATCRFYQPPPEDEGDATRRGPFGSCLRVMHGNDNPGFLWSDDEPPTSELDLALQHLRITEKAAVQDGSGYIAILRVKPDFGCVLHEIG